MRRETTAADLARDLEAEEPLFDDGFSLDDLLRAESDEEEEAPERRAAPRRLIARHIIALGERAARVLLGRDISVHGMRVDPNSGIAVGESLRLALHARAGDAPLVVSARVERDDGAAGLWLRFSELSAEESSRLEEMLARLPVLASFGNVAEDPLMVWEIVGR